MKELLAKMFWGCFGYIFTAVSAVAFGGAIWLWDYMEVPTWLDVIVWAALLPFLLLFALLYIGGIAYSWVGLRNDPEEKKDDE